MLSFTGLEYLKIDIANQAGLDKESWDKRLDWVNLRMTDLEYYDQKAAEPMLYRKAVRALRDTQAGIPTGFIMGLDATASGYQIMAVLSGCLQTAKNVNLIYSGKREDLYTNIADQMNLLDGVSVTRDMLKKPIMTVAYGSKAQPKSIFGEDTPELKAFYQIMNTELPGAMRVMKALEWCWDDNALYHQWTLPDGHVARCNVLNPLDKKIEVDELDHATFTHRAIVNSPREYGVEIVANVVHSIDGYIAREMVRKSRLQGFQMLHIHDSFWCSPNHMQLVRQNYLTILCNIADSKLLQDIICDIKGDPNLTMHKITNNLSNKMQDAEYALS